jgi:hypothetical protein
LPQKSPKMGVSESTKRLIFLLLPNIMASLNMLIISTYQELSPRMLIIARLDHYKNILALLVLFCPKKSPKMGVSGSTKRLIFLLPSHIMASLNMPIISTYQELSSRILIIARLDHYKNILALLVFLRRF